MVFPAHRILIVFPFVVSSSPFFLFFLFFFFFIFYKKKAVQIYIIMGKWTNASTYGSYKFMF